MYFIVHLSVDLKIFLVASQIVGFCVVLLAKLGVKVAKVALPFEVTTSATQNCDEFPELIGNVKMKYAFTLHRSG